MCKEPVSIDAALRDIDSFDYLHEYIYRYFCLIKQSILIQNLPLTSHWVLGKLYTFPGLSFSTYIMCPHGPD